MISSLSSIGKWVIGLGKIPDTHYPYSNLDPNYLNPRYLIPNLDSDSNYLNLVWVIRVISPGTQTTRICVCLCVCDMFTTTESQFTVGTFTNGFDIIGGDTYHRRLMTYV